MKHLSALAIAALSFAVAGSATAQDFKYEPPGQLVSGSGTGRVDDTVYVPDMRFPIEVSPAYPNSQVWGVGGSQGPSGGQCDERNYSYPWHDNYCESRRWDMPLCPSGTGHQGQDIRPSTCDKDTHWVVAAEGGQVTNIGSYSVYVVTDSGTQHRYLHMNPGRLNVRQGQRVNKGDRLGLVSNAFGGTPTTIHLHYDIKKFVQSVGQSVYVPTYMSLVRSYETLIGVEAEPCAILPADGGIVDDYGPCFSTYGPSRFWREESGNGVEGRFHWTNAYDGANPSNWARWRLHFAEEGQYRVEFNVVDGFNRARKVRYRITHKNGEDDVIIDQSTIQDWGELGVFRFDPEVEYTVDVFDNSGETASDLHVTADAIRITPMQGGGPDDPVVVEDPEPTDGNNVQAGTPTVNGDPSTGGSDTDRPLTMEPNRDGLSSASTANGCSTTGSAGPGALVLVFFGLLLGIRRR